MCFDHKLNYKGSRKLNKEIYWNNLNRLFNLFLSNYKKTKLIVAAHPRRNSRQAHKKRFIYDNIYN